MIDIALCLHLMVSPQYEYGGAVSSNTKQEYDAIRWADDRPKPTWQALGEWWEINKDSIMGALNA